MANLIALLYNWWHLYAGDHHREAITSRPAEKGDLIEAAITAVSNTLQRLNAIAE